jgi:hypothetical protein
MGYMMMSRRQVGCAVAVDPLWIRGPASDRLSLHFSNCGVQNFPLNLLQRLQKLLRGWLETGLPISELGCHSSDYVVTWCNPSRVLPVCKVRDCKPGSSAIMAANNSWPLRCVVAKCNKLHV